MDRSKTASKVSRIAHFYLLAFYHRPTACPEKKGRFPYTWCHEILYTENLYLLRDELNEYKNYEHPVYVDVVTAAAPNLKHEHEPAYQTYYDVLTTVFMSPILSKTHNRTIILGAWGCGAFRNDPNVIARITMDVIVDYGGHLQNIVIAIPKQYQQYQQYQLPQNYDIFKKKLKDYKIPFQEM